ncbi:MAG: TerB family tellurite resistance protein [Deltaproteobacteria bacterium]|nr:TerB family tellurite resistance protein [Deltaproteobacteria bacterium]
MGRVDDYLDLVEDPSGEGLVLGDPADEALIALLVQVAFSDGVVDDRELSFMEKVLPGRDPEELREWIQLQGSTDLDLEALGEALPTLEERWAGLRFAARMAFKDGVLAEQERDLLARLSVALELPRNAHERVLGEMEGRVKVAVTAERLSQALASNQWKAVQHGSGELRSTLNALVPEGTVILGRIGLDNVEVLGFTDQGIVGRFREGEAFVPWEDVVTYSRAPDLGAAIRIHTESGRCWTLVDHRLNGLGPFFDKLFASPDQRPRGPGPKVLRVRGEE